MNTRLASLLCEGKSMDRNHRRHLNQPISISATVGNGRILAHPRLAIAIVLALQIAFTVLFLTAGMA